MASFPRLIPFTILIAILVLGISTTPFNWNIPFIPKSPISVDAIPDLGENQQIIATEWMGRSPKDVQEQVTYPLTTALLGIPGVKVVRSTSMFGMSFIYVIFEESIEFYWSRSRILEKLNSLPVGLLPQGVQPALGPDATALGQIFWYTLEGRNPQTDEPTGGWDPDTLRTIQDFYVKYALASAAGVSEVSSIGGFVKEYQIEINPDALRAFNVSIMDVMNAVQKSNLDISAETIEMNLAEYLVRGIGIVKSIADLEETVVSAYNGVPVRIKDIAFVNIGPAARRGGLDKEGVEATGGVVVSRYGANPMETIKNIKAKIDEINSGMPRKILEDGTTSQVVIVPFYDRSVLIKETIQTLETALFHEILICILAVTVLVFRLRASLVIASILPLAVLSTFIIMRLLGIEANVVALSGIAIAIGVVLDVGIVMVESILKEADISKSKPFREVISVGVKNISAPLITGMVTTLISFLPVLALTAQEGKLFKPLAYTKTFTMAFALLLGFTVLPTIAYYFLKKYDLKKEIPQNITKIIRIAAVLIVTIILTAEWTPLGYNAGFAWNLIFVVFAVGIILAALWFLVAFYEKILSWCLGHKLIFLVFVSIMVLCGLLIWKGMGQEFMPSLDEGDFLLMPTSAPHSGVERNLELIAALDRRISAIPEIENTVGKWGRVNSALDPAPVQMFENVINYKPEYALDSSGKRVRQWREHIKTTDDIWQEIAKVSQLPGLTSSPKLHPIAARQVMLATGMRAAMGLKISGPSLEAIELGGKALEAALKEIPAIESNTVFYDRSISAPYLEIRLDRVEMARYGLTVTGLQDIVSAAVGGMTLTTAIDGIERFPVRLRYPRELRNNPEALAGILIPTETGAQIPLGNVAKINYAIGAQMIRSENTFLIGYIIFDKMESIAEVDAVLQAKAILDEKVKNGELALPPGVSYKFAGSYEQQQHATARLKIIIPIALIAIFLVLFYLFRTVTASCIHFSGIIIAFAGGFFMLWLYDQSWFLNFSMGGENLRHIFHIRTVNLSVAVWVGFIALFGISTNDGVLMGTYIHETFKKLNPQTKSEIKAAVIKAGLKRVRPAAMTTATTLIALLPVLTSTGKGSDIMVPMAIPAFGGMLIQSITMFTVPVLQCAWRERVLSNSSTTALN